MGSCALYYKGQPPQKIRNGKMVGLIDCDNYLRYYTLLFHSIIQSEYNQFFGGIFEHHFVRA